MGDLVDKLGRPHKPWAKALGRTGDLELAESLAHREYGLRVRRKLMTKKSHESRRAKAKSAVQRERDSKWAEKFREERNYDPVGFRKLIEGGNVKIKQRDAGGQGKGGLGEFKPRLWQKALIGEFVEHRRTGRTRWLEVVIKSRQLGFSTLWDALIFTDAECNPGIECAVAAHRDKTLLALNQNFRTFVGREDAKEVGRLKRLADKIIETPKGSLIHFDTATDSFGRGGSLTHIHVSEADYIQDLDGAMESVLASMMKHSCASAVFESTLRRNSGSDFKAFIEQRVNEQEKLAATGGSGIEWLDSNFKVRFIPWTSDESARMDMSKVEAEKFASFIESTDNPHREYELELRDRNKLSLEQIVWWHKMCQEDANGDQAKMREAYPTTWEEALSMVRGASFFDAASLSWMRTTCRTPRKRYRATFDGLTETDAWNSDTLDTWEEPVPGRRYAIGVDCRNSAAYGIGSALNYAVVLDIDNGVQVAEYAGLMGASEFAIAVWRAAQKYNDALIVPETGGDGGAFIDYLRNVLGYWRVYERETFGKTTVRESGQYGFNVTPQNRSILMGRLQDNVNECRVEVRSYRLHDHLMNLNRHGGANVVGKTDKARTREEADDGAMALAFTFFGHKMGLSQWQDKRFMPRSGNEPVIVTATQAQANDWIQDLFGERRRGEPFAHLMDG